MLNSTVIKSAIVVGVVAISGLVMSNTNSSGSTGGVDIVTKSQVATSVTDTITPPSVRQFKLTRLSPAAEQIIIFNTPVAYETVEAAIERLESLRLEGYEEAFISFDSPGGSVIDGAKLRSYMLGSPMKIHTICDGMCASMAAHLFEVGKVRYMTDKSLLMFHPASGGLQGTLEQMLNQLTMIKRYVDRMDAEIAQRAKIEYNDFKARLVSEYWLETEDAITEKLADTLVFVAYSSQSKEALNMSSYLKSKKINIPQNLLKPGVLVYPSIRLEQISEVK